MSTTRPTRWRDQLVVGLPHEIRIRRIFWDDDRLCGKLILLLRKLPQQMTIAELQDELNKAGITDENAVLDCCVTNANIPHRLFDSSALTNAVTASDPISRLEWAKKLYRFSSFADESQSATLLRLWRSVDTTNPELEELASTLLSATLRAWRTDLGDQDVERAFDLLCRTSRPFGKEFQLALRVAEAAGSDPETYIVRLLEIIEEKAPLKSNKEKALPRSNEEKALEESNEKEHDRMMSRLTVAYLWSLAAKSQKSLTAGRELQKRFITYSGREFLILTFTKDHLERVSSGWAPVVGPMREAWLPKFIPEIASDTARAQISAW